jgi:hypothetical protein
VHGENLSETKPCNRPLPLVAQGRKEREENPGAFLVNPSKRILAFLAFFAFLAVAKIYS